MKLKLLHLITGGLIISLCWPGAGHAAGDEIGHGLQLAIAGHGQLKMSSEFTGTPLPDNEPMAADQVIIDVPELPRQGFGLAGRLGYKGQNWAWEFQYTQSQLNKQASALELADPQLTMTFYDLNAKYYLFQPLQVQGYFIFGIGYTTLSGSAMKRLPDLSLESASYSGWGYNLGVGLSFYLSQMVFIFSDYMYRGLSYTMLDQQNLKEALSHPLHTFYLGIGYALGGR